MRFVVFRLVDVQLLQQQLHSELDLVLEEFVEVCTFLLVPRVVIFFQQVASTQDMTFLVVLLQLVLDTRDSGL